MSEGGGTADIVAAEVDVGEVPTSDMRQRPSWLGLAKVRAGVSADWRYLTRSKMRMAAANGRPGAVFLLRDSVATCCCPAGSALRWRPRLA